MRQTQCENCGEQIGFIRMLKSGNYCAVDAQPFYAEKDDPYMRVVHSNGMMQTGIVVGQFGYTIHAITCKKSRRKPLVIRRASQSGITKREEA
jgi:hypothetical protein